MRTLDKNTPVLLALGYFDSLHVGHREVIKRAKSEAEKLNLYLVVFTFGGNLRAATTGEEQKFIYNAKEREKLMLSLGVDEVYFAPVDKDFLSLTKDEFLEKINALYNIKGYVSGSDYRFGKGASGNVEHLREYAERNGQKVVTVEEILFDGKKASTTWVKQLLYSGKIEMANALLGANFFIKGRVVKDRGVGKKLGFPTANITLQKERQPLKNGVYKGRVIVDDIERLAVINYGARPTFNQDNIVLEAHILDFEGNLYDKEITVIFDGFIREIITFKSEEELKLQLKKDVENVKKYYD